MMKFRGRQKLLVLLIAAFSLGQAVDAQAGKRTVPASRNPAKIAGVRTPATPHAAKVVAAALATPLTRTPASAREISEAIDITGQSRNLSMGLMFQRDKDKLSFGSPRTNYKDKITSQQTNY